MNIDVQFYLMKKCLCHCFHELNMQNHMTLWKCTEFVTGCGDDRISPLQTLYVCLEKHFEGIFRPSQAGLKFFDTSSGLRYLNN